eukprot:gene18171-24603_t
MQISRAKPHRKPRKTLFDVMPGQMPGTAIVAPMAPALQVPGLPGFPVYVGGLPPTANEQSIATFFSHALAAIGGNTAGPGTAVVNVYINREKNFSFVEFRTVEETSNAMALDGIMFEGVSVRVRRPNDYNPTAALALGSPNPNPALNLAAIGLGGAGTGGGPEEQCRELLGSFGAIKTFDYVKDRETGNGKGRKKKEEGMGTMPGVPNLNIAAMAAAAASAVPGAAIGAMGIPQGATRIVVLTDAVTMDEIMDDEEYSDIIEDMREECQKHGQTVSVAIPRPTPENQNPPGMCKVVIEFADMMSAVKARGAMNGRKFGGRTVTAVFLPEESFAIGQFDDISS